MLEHRLGQQGVGDGDRIGSSTSRRSPAGASTTCSRPSACRRSCWSLTLPWKAPRAASSSSPGSNAGAARLPPCLCRQASTRKETFSWPVRKSAGCEGCSTRRARRHLRPVHRFRWRCWDCPDLRMPATRRSSSSMSARRSRRRRGRLRTLSTRPTKRARATSGTAERTRGRTPGLAITHHFLTPLTCAEQLTLRLASLDHWLTPSSQSLLH